MTTAVQDISPSSTMAEILEIYPGAQRALFRGYHIGGCSSCGFQQTETLEQVCKRNGDLNLSEVTDYIRKSHEQDLRIEITPAELKETLKRKGTVRLLDIRTREEWDAAKISGAILFTQEIMNEMLGRWPREELLVIYDHLGNKSMDAAAYFLGHGFTDVRALRGGIDAWAEQVDPSIRRYRLE
jgi:rhodanese-related sulfurtransferase